MTLERRRHRPIVREVQAPHPSDEDHPWPPPTITRWLDSHPVNADELSEELRYWSVRMAGGKGDEPSITCPSCGLTSYHPKDIEVGYCGNCHWWTTPVAGRPNLPPPGVHR